MTQRRLTARIKRAFLYYEGECLLDLISAARKAGYTNPYRSAQMLQSIWGDKLAEIEDRVKSSVVLTSKDVLGRLSVVAQDVRHKDHVRALEILARVHGLLSDKMDVRVDLSTLTQQLAIATQRVKLVAAEVRQLEAPNVD